MGNSTISLQSAFDVIAGKGIPDPRLDASGFGDSLALDCGNNVMADLLTERFNWKFNRATAAPFYTNSWQQDYPQLAQSAGKIGWGEDFDLIDINNTSLPKPLYHPKIRRGLSRTMASAWRPENVCWMYNKDLSLGIWPGAGVVYSPLVTAQPAGNNPLMSMQDKNGNILIVTTFGTTGLTAPFAPANSAEGVTVNDGTVVWTVVDGDSQGFRLDYLPSATSVVFQGIFYFQLEPPTLTALSDLINPIPNSFSRHFQRGLEAECYAASPNPNDKQRGAEAKAAWMRTLIDAIKQGDKEPNYYGLQPASAVVTRCNNRGPRTAENPYGY